MDLEIRHLLCDLENGRYINSPDDALRFLGRAYLQIGPFEFLEDRAIESEVLADGLKLALVGAGDEIESLNEKISELEEENEKLGKKLDAK